MHPGDRTYRNHTLRLADLTVTDDIISAVTFENCTLVGPAVVIFLGGTLTGSAFEGDATGLLWPLGDRDHVIGAVAFKDCTIVSCRFQRVGVAYPPDQEAAMRTGLGL